MEEYHEGVVKSIKVSMQSYIIEDIEDLLSKDDTKTINKEDITKIITEGHMNMFALVRDQIKMNEKVVKEHSKP